MSNRTGYIMGICCALVYNIFIYGIDSNYILDFFASFLGSLLIPVIISGLISLFVKKSFGKIFGITCLIVFALGAIGSNY
ncbi:hypothetical protein [Hyunsoonleella rubra]|uniref:Uncharacterized protein n=1 Tax=Hyunsoonleella rubra TaxID=1737062 RepID=A0ABW5TAN1_9FLAO